MENLGFGSSNFPQKSKNHTLKDILVVILVIAVIASSIVAWAWVWLRPEPPSGPFHIRLDGSIYPPTALISKLDNFIYMFTDNIINGSIVVERDNIVIDGAGYTLQGTGDGYGINLTGRTNVTIQNTIIRAFGSAILLEDSSYNNFRHNDMTNNIYAVLVYASSSNNIIENNLVANSVISIVLTSSSSNSISGNNVTCSGNGIILDGSHFNNITGNNIEANIDRDAPQELRHFGEYYGVSLWGSNNNSISENDIINGIDGVVLHYAMGNNISGNNIINATRGVFLSFGDFYAMYTFNRFWHNNFINRQQISHIPSVRSYWDSGYANGNYWSDYAGVDADGDGIGDTPYIIDEDNRDNYPLMSPYGH
jgi:parallel beta-helix repeat protein